MRAYENLINALLKPGDELNFKVASAEDIPDEDFGKAFKAIEAFLQEKSREDRTAFYTIVDLYKELGYLASNGSEYWQKLYLKLDSIISQGSDWEHD